LGQKIKLKEGIVKEIVPIKKKPNTLQWDNRKDTLRIPLESLRSYHHRAKDEGLGLI
jgi:hypothetical protein